MSSDVDRPYDNAGTGELSHRPSPDTCGCTQPRYHDVLAEIWCRFTDDIRCVPINRPTRTDHLDATSRTVTWPTAGAYDTID